jgi:hypothetical protein
MPAVMTKFSVWEADTRTLIQDIYNEIKKYNDKKHIVTPADQQQLLTNWFYTKGIEVFSLSQAAFHKQFVDAYLKNHAHRPEVTYERILANKLHGFQSLYPALLSYFSIRNDGLEFYIRDEYQGYRDKGLKHEAFFRLQAEVTTTLNSAIDNNPAMTEAEKVAYVVERYEAAKEIYPELVSEIDDQLLLQKEFSEYMAEKKQLAAAGNDGSLFGASDRARADAETVRRARDLLGGSFDFGRIDAAPKQRM